MTLNSHGESERASRRDRAVLGGAAVTFGVRLLMVSTSFVSLGIAARSLSPADFGLLSVLASAFLVLTMFDLGVGGAMAVRIASSHARQGTSTVRAHMHDALIAMTVIAVVVGSIGVASAFVLPWDQWVGGQLAPDTVVRGIVITAIAAGASFPAAIGEMTLTAMQRFKAGQAIVAISSIASVLSTTIAALFHPSADVFVGTIIGSPVLAALICTLSVRFRVLRDDDPPIPFGRDRLVSLLRSSGWFAIYLSATTVSVGFGTVITAYVLGPVAAAIFGVCSRLLSPIITFVMTIGSLMRPGMTEALARGDREWARTRYRRSVLFNAAASGTLGIVVIAAGPYAARVWVGAALVPSRSLFVWSAAFTVAVAIAGQVSVILMAANRVRDAAVLSVVAALVTVIGSTAFATELGIDGVAIGQLLGCGGILLPGLVILAARAGRDLWGAGADCSPARDHG